MNSPRLWSLWDIMNAFNLNELLAILSELNMAASTLRKIKDAPIASINFEPLLEMCRRAERFCLSVGFVHSGKKAWSLAQRVQVNFNNYDCAILLGEVLSLQEDLSVEMYDHRFVQIHKSDICFLESEHLFGEQTSAAFPAIEPDLKEAGKCLAFGCPTAAVFHLMRVVEWGLRALCKKLKVTKMKQGPIEFATWDDILKDLPKAVEAKVDAMTRGPEKQKVQEFYFGALKDVRGFKDAWRNHIMHARNTYTRQDAIAVWSHVQRFMTSLAVNGIKGAKVMP